METTGEAFNVWELILAASITVQIVMLILVFFSISSWVLIIQRFMVLSRTDRQNKQFEDRFWGDDESIDSLYEEFSEIGEEEGGTTGVFVAGMTEYKRLESRENDTERLVKSVDRVMNVSLVREDQRLNSYLPYLATVASVSPYVGLFGTVWGIMNAFIGLAGVQQATLNTVAPGIAEALIATAIGLFAAIPALVAYNRFAVQATDLATGTSTFSEELLSVLSRKAGS
ncbi:MAG: protein TolQ [Gammaproteobacteria bacterium AqS3]|nr:protein TolQ [Gammaproteobacteria bacterium AqS3]